MATAATAVVQSLGGAAVQFTLVFLGRCIYAITGFGNGLMYQLGWQVCSQAEPLLCSGLLTDAVSRLTIEGSLSNTLQAMKLWHCINWPLAQHMMPASGVGMALGLGVLYSTNSVWLKRSMGLMFLLVGLFKLWSELKSCRPGAAAAERAAGSSKAPSGQYDCRPWKPKLGLLAASLLSGFLGGLFSVSGPPFMVWVIYTGIAKDEWRGTAALVGCANNLVRAVIVFVVEGQYTFFFRQWLEVVALVSAVLLGLALGNWLASAVDATVFRRMVLVILLAGSGSIISAETTPRTTFAVMGIVALTISAVAGSWACCERYTSAGAAGLGQSTAYERVLADADAVEEGMGMQLEMASIKPPDDDEKLVMGPCAGTCLPSPQEFDPCRKQYGV